MIYLAGDRHASQFLSWTRQFFAKNAIPFEEFGFALDQEAKLETFIPQVVGGVRSSPENIGVLFCGTGVGVAVGAGKHRGIRATLVNDPVTARRAREYDNVNVLCMASWSENDRVQPEGDEARRYLEEVIDAFLTAEFDRDPGRIVMLDTFETFR